MVTATTVVMVVTTAVMVTIRTTVVIVMQLAMVVMVTDMATGTTTVTIWRKRKSENDAKNRRKNTKNRTRNIKSRTRKSTNRKEAPNGRRKRPSGKPPRHLLRSKHLFNLTQWWIELNLQFFHLLTCMIINGFTFKISIFLCFLKFLIQCLKPYRYDLSLTLLFLRNFRKFTTRNTTKLGNLP